MCFEAIFCKNYFKSNKWIAWQRFMFSMSFFVPFWLFVKTLTFTTINKRKIAENMKLFGERHHLYGKNLDIAQLQGDEAQSGGISGSLFSYGYLFLFLLIASVLSYLMNTVFNDEIWKCVLKQSFVKLF